MSNVKKIVMAAALGLAALEANAHERSLTYVDEPDVLPAGTVEFEQWLTGRFDRDGGDYSRWDFREEIEFGVTERFTTALHLNFEDEFFSPDDDTAEESEGGLDFTGVGLEGKYQLVNPYKYPVGVLAYVEAITDGAHETELEEKLVFGSYGDLWMAALNLVLEQEWEREDGETEEESAFEVTAGVSRKLNGHWAAGLEAMHVRQYVDGLDLAEEEYTATFVGPNLHYQAGKWWATLTVMPQVHGDGDGADGGLQLEHRERIETRLIAGVLL